MSNRLRFRFDLSNRRALRVPLEDSAQRYVEKEHATTRRMYLKPGDLPAENTVTVASADGPEGMVATDVTRAAVRTK